MSLSYTHLFCVMNLCYIQKRRFIANSYCSLYKVGYTTHSKKGSQDLAISILVLLSGKKSHKCWYFCGTYHCQRGVHFVQTTYLRTLIPWIKTHQVSLSLSLSPINISCQSQFQLNYHHVTFPLGNSLTSLH